MCRSALGLLVTLLVAAACSADPDETPSVTVRDSAGVRIVENRVPGGVAPTYAELGAADLEIGVVEGEPAYSFTSIVDVRSLSDGSILVAESRSSELRVFNSEGRHVRSLGRQGEGPGEFMSLGNVSALIGDTIEVWDRRLSRLTRVRTDGEVVGDLRFQQAQDQVIAEVWRFADGTYLAVLVDFGASNRAQGMFYEAPQPLIRVDVDGLALDTVGTAGGIDMIVVRETDASGRQMTMIMDRPLGRSAHFAVRGERVYTGWNGEYQVVGRTLAGDPELVTRAPDLVRPVDPAEFEALRQNRLDTCTNESCERFARTVFDHSELPERRPAFLEFRLDALENLWVAEYEPFPEAVAGWHVFSPDGELLGRVAVPPGLDVHEIGEDYVLGVQENDFDVPFVRRFPLTRFR